MTYHHKNTFSNTNKIHSAVSRQVLYSYINIKQQKERRKNEIKYVYFFKISKPNFDEINYDSYPI